MWKDRLHIVKAAIDNWDPYLLLASGAPKDEFDSESLMVSSQIKEDSSISEIAEIISKVFLPNFLTKISRQKVAWVWQKNLKRA